MTDRKPAPETHCSWELMKHEAKPCPFCGQQPFMSYWHGGGPLKRMVFCDNSACVVSPQVSGSTKTRALNRWNWRYNEGSL